MEYAIAKVYFLGNDDVNFQGFTARKVESLKDWKAQIKEAMKAEIESEGYIEISNSDNCATPFDSVEELMNTITFKKITEEEFNTLKNLLGGNDKQIKYGNDLGYLDYHFPEATEATKKKLKR
jgi:hypothetical protein